jgi:hypothetical protein
MEFCGTKQVVRMGYTWNAYRNLVRNLLGISPLEKARRRSEDNIRMYFTRTNCEGARWMGLTEIRVQWHPPMLAVLHFSVLLSQRLSALYTPLFGLGHTFIEQNFNKCTVYAIVSPLSTISFITLPPF